MVSAFKTQIRTWLDQGESVQIVAPTGFGKSRLGKSLGGLFIDPNLLQSPTEILETIKNSPERKLIVIDNFDELLTSEYVPLFKFLKGLRDQHKYQLAYVFLTSKVVDHELSALLGDLVHLVNEHIEHMPTLEISEYDLFGFNATSQQLQKIAQVSGGIPHLVKACILAMRDGKSLESVLPTPDLSASETRLLELLKTHQSTIVSKDVIAQAVYPEVKNYDGITDHSIDQLVHRLRSKIKNKYSLTTHRGRGYKLA